MSSVVCRSVWLAWTTECTRSTPAGSERGPFRERKRQRDLRLLAAGEGVDPLVERDPQPFEPLSREVAVPARVQPFAGFEHLGEAEATIERMVLGDEADTRQHKRRPFPR